MNIAMHMRKWGTPFADHLFPTIESVNQSHHLEIRLRSQGNLYQIRFNTVVALRLTDEQIPWGGPGFTGFHAACAILELEEWINEYGENRSYILMLHGGNPTHYIIFGAEWIVEVLSTSLPEVELCNTID